MTSCWIVTEGLAGTENQCIGVAETLGVIPVIKRVHLRQPWKTLSPYLAMECSCSFTGDSLTKPWPDLLLAAGRKAVAPARYIKKASGGKTFTVFLQDPRINPSQFDLVAVPEHDSARGDNVIVTGAAPNRITKEQLETARQDFDEQLARLPMPRVAVMIGGNSKAYTMTPAITRELTRQLEALANQGYGLMITASRRTGDTNRKILHEALSDHPGIYFWDDSPKGKGSNPYFGFLAWADFILVTADSVSMLSEAATTGKPVYMIELKGGTKRINSFHNNLLNKNIIRRFSGTLETYDYTHLNDAALIAREIRARLKK